MTFRRICRGVVWSWVIAGAMTLGSATAQTTGWEPPVTPWGDPDLQGQWNSQTSIPLERPLEGPLAEREALTEEEAAVLERENRARYDLPPDEGDPGTYNAFWRDIGNPLARTSLIVDPPDGRIPALNAEGRARLDAEAAERRERGPADSPDTYVDLSNWTRCISRGWNGIGSWYSSNYQIFQAPGYVVVFQELIHEARIIPLDGRPHLPGTVRQWMGDSRGHWEGSTLVVETTNFDPKTNFRGSRDTLHLVERYTRVDDDTIDYRFTITDPHTFTRRWTVVRPMTRIADRRSIFEYACHEGNYGMAGILAGARAEERTERDAADTSTGARDAAFDRDAVAVEVAAALSEYHRTFSSKDASAMADHAYGAPLMSLGQENHTVWSTPTEIESWAGRFVGQLQAQGWDRSDMPAPSICVLTPTSAIASGEFVRYRPDGTVLSRHGNAYVFSKEADGWRVVAMLAHDRDRPLRCD